MSGLFGSITIKGNRITDFAGQTATVGIPIPFGEGVYEAPGNIIWNSELKEHVKKKKQGKGGVKTEEYSYTCSYAIGFSERNYGYLTITRSGKIVYTTDPNATVEDTAYAAKWLEKATLYYGTKEQLPDPTIEAIKGVGNVTAHRNLAYIVVKDDDVTAEGGAIPQYNALCIGSPPEVFLTTPPYPLHFIEGLMPQLNQRYGATFEQIVEDIGVDFYPMGGTLRAILQNYSLGAPESVIPSLAPIGGTLKTILQTYNFWPNDPIMATLTPAGGTIEVTLLNYPNYAPEGLNVALTPIGGTKI